MASSTTDRRLGLTGGVAFKAPVACATTANITLSGEQTIDGVTTSTSRVLVKNQTTASQNGIYRTSTASWTRDIDANGNLDLVSGTMVLVFGGSTQAGQVWQLTTSGTITIGTTSLTWVQSLTASSALVSFLQAGSGAVARTAQAKMREHVSLEDFYDGSFSDALEEASAVGKTVHIFGSYTWDALANIATSTRFVFHGVTLTAATGFSGTHMLTCATGTDVVFDGDVRFVGSALTAPSASWAGSGVPQGSCIYAAGASSGSRSGRLKFVGSGILFSGFPSGPVYAKWLAEFHAEEVRAQGCQTATVQWKASGSYVGITTTNAGTSTAPIGELITSANLEVFECDVVRLRNNIIPAVSKGTSVKAIDYQASGNVYSLGTPRHAMEHTSGCSLVNSTANIYNGDSTNLGIPYKHVACPEVIAFGHTFFSNIYCGYIQDCGVVNVGPDTSTETTGSVYYLAVTSEATSAMDDVTIHIGSLKGAGGSSAVIGIASEASAVAAGYSLGFVASGGRVGGFSSPIANNTSGIGMTVDIDWKGTTVDGCTAPMDLRCRSCDIDLTFRDCTGTGLIDLGSMRDTSAQTVVAGRSASVKINAINCSATALVRGGAGANIDLSFQRVDIDVKSAGGSPTLVTSFSFGTTAASSDIGYYDDLKAMSLRMNCSDIAGSGGQAISFNAKNKAFKFDLDPALVIGTTSFIPLNLTLLQSTSVTGVYRGIAGSSMAGALTGGALTLIQASTATATST